MLLRLVYERRAMRSRFVAEIVFCCDTSRQEDLHTLENGESDVTTDSTKMKRSIDSDRH